MKSLLVFVLAVFVTAGLFMDCLAETEKTVTVEYIGYVKDYTSWHSSTLTDEAKQRIEFLLLIVVQDGQKLVVKETQPSNEFKNFLKEVKVGTTVYLTVGSSLLGAQTRGSTGEYIKSMTNLTNGRKYNR